MSKKIFKYQLENTHFQKVEMPKGAEILCIQTQNEIPCIWALVEPNASLTCRVFETFFTGHEVPENANRKYVGTYQLANGAYVFHLFELLSLS
jgi:hypothetical protein